VQLEGQVILKLVKHCQECEPALVTGQLLGLDIGQTLEVTDCFPFPVRYAAVQRDLLGLTALLVVATLATMCLLMCLPLPHAFLGFGMHVAFDQLASSALES